jgi:uncharacterized membrane protein YkvA (DUF1232 family)
MVRVNSLEDTMFLLRLRMFFKAAGRDLLQLGYAWRHPSTPRSVKLGSLLLLAYVVSPIDVLPDWLPLLGITDDILVASLAVPFLLRKLPADARRDTEFSSRNFWRRFGFWKA